MGRDNEQKEPTQRKTATPAESARPEKNTTKKCLACYGNEHKNCCEPYRKMKKRDRMQRHLTSR